MLSPYLHFAGTCAEALEAYRALFGGELTLMRYSDMPDAPEIFATSDRVMNGELRAPELGLLRASDAPPGEGGDPQQAVTLCLELADVDRGRSVFAALADGGDLVQDYGPSFFAPGFGMLRDRFGTHWMVVAGSPPAS